MKNRSQPELRKFVAPEFVFGIDARLLAGQYAHNFGARKALIVTDAGVTAAGWTADIMKSLEGAGVAYTVFDKVTPNPRSEEVMEGAEHYHREQCNIIVAVGGGSPMDCAKGIGIVCSNKQHILTFEGIDQVEMPMPPLICIPTTGGTAADISQFAIISNRQEMVKIAIISKAVIPDVALVDPQTLTTMDPYLTACTGIDALVHGIEAFVSNAHSPFTDMHALEAIRLISTYIEESVKVPLDLKLRQKIMRGSLEAGLAFSNASLGAVHAMAHSLGGLLDLPHGECNAMLLPHVFAFNHAKSTNRYQQIGKTMGLDMHGMKIKEQKKAIFNEIERLRQVVNVNRKLADVGVGLSDIPILARKAIKDACMVTNPRQPTQRDIELVYEEAL
ncbi:MAG: iron-containing alcohol dehydrogenase [Chloroflexi bacterium]|nr:MAG: iron-containing alcohol dehydrogenase [Chloroflexota bacterium]